MSNTKEPSKRPKLKPPLGGLNHVERYLGFRQDRGQAIDAVFISLDLEVAADRRKLYQSVWMPLVTQIGFATLDTRDIHALSCASNLHKLISVRVYTVSDLNLSKRARSKVTSKCVFAKPKRITQDEIQDTIVANLKLADAKSPNSNTLRQVVLVGQSLREDLKILEIYDIDIFTLIPLLTVVDTHTIARHLFPPYHPSLPLPKDEKEAAGFSLSGILAKLGCLPAHSEFHNAGNDAVYTIYAMLLLSIKRGISVASHLSNSELRSLQLLKGAVFRAFSKGVSSATFDIRNENYKPPATLGGGLREAATALQLLREQKLNKKHGPVEREA